MKYYIQENNDGIIYDIVTIPVENYREIEYAEVLPVGVYGGWFSFDGANFVEHLELKPKTENADERIELLEQQNSLLRGCIMELASEVYGGVQ